MQDLIEKLKSNIIKMKQQGADQQQPQYANEKENLHKLETVYRIIVMNEDDRLKHEYLQYRISVLRENFKFVQEMIAKRCLPNSQG